MVVFVLLVCFFALKEKHCYKSRQFILSVIVLEHAVFCSVPFGSILLCHSVSSCAFIIDVDVFLVDGEFQRAATF